MAPLSFTLPYVQSYKPPRRHGKFYYNPLHVEKQRAQASLASQYEGGKPMEGPVWAEVVFTLSMAKSWPVKKRESLAGTPCLKKIDVDNCLKFLFDSLKDIVIVDDCQIWHCIVSKVWGDQSATKVVISNFT